MNKKAIGAFAITASILILIAVVITVLIYTLSGDGTDTFQSKTTSLSFTYPGDLKESQGDFGGPRYGDLPTVTEADLVNISTETSRSVNEYSVSQETLQSLTVTSLTNPTNEQIEQMNWGLKEETAGIYNVMAENESSPVAELSFYSKDIKGTEALIRYVRRDRFGMVMDEYDLGIKVSDTYYIISFHGKSDLDNEQVWNQIVSTMKF